MAADYTEAAKKFITVAITAAKGDSDFLRDQVERIVLMYGERARAAKANTGNVFDDPIINGDIFFCKRIAS